MNEVGRLPEELLSASSPRLLIINNMPAYYRTLPFKALLDAYSRRTGGVGLVAYQVRRDSVGRGEWFFTPDAEFPYQPYFSAADTTSSSTRTGYPLKLDLKLWRDFRPDHVFTAGWDSPLSLTAAVYTRLRQSQLGVWVESNSTTSRRRGGPTDMVRKLFLQSADFAVVPTVASSAYVEELAGFDMRSVRLKNPVSWDRLPDTSIRVPPRRLVFIGDLTRRKGFDYFVNTLTAGADAGWVGVAWGRDVEGLAATVPENLSIRPAAPLASIVPQLLSSDILVIPSRVDPAPLTYSEALALGLRVLVSDRIAYGSDAAGASGSAQVDPADSPTMITVAERLREGGRPSVERGIEVSPSFWADAVLRAFRL